MLDTLPRLQGETLLTLGQAAQEVPSRKGGTANPATVWRWAKAGARAKSGERIRLETLVIGGTTYTSFEALGRFLAALNEPASTSTPTSIIKSTATRRREAARAEKANARFYGVASCGSSH